jgi:hypothetical protein
MKPFVCMNGCSIVAVLRYNVASHVLVTPYRSLLGGTRKIRLWCNRGSLQDGP